VLLPVDVRGPHGEYITRLYGSTVSCKFFDQGIAQENHWVLTLKMNNPGQVLQWRTITMLIGELIPFYSKDQMRRPPIPADFRINWSGKQKQEFWKQRPFMTWECKALFNDGAYAQSKLSVNIHAAFAYPIILQLFTTIYPNANWQDLASLLIAFL
jgi:hypothetical protein